MHKNVANIFYACLQSSLRMFDLRLKFVKCKKNMHKLFFAGFVKSKSWRIWPFRCKIFFDKKRMPDLKHFKR